MTEEDQHNDQQADGLTFRPPGVADAADVWRLSRKAGALDENSPYAYLLVCSHFAATSTVATDGSGKIVGFASCYRPPTSPEAVFVWQIAIDPEMQGRGLGRRLLDAALDQPANRDASFVEATVTESNEPSTRLFRSLAARRDTGCDVSVMFPADAFPDGGHQAELLFRIGPIRSEMSHPAVTGPSGPMATTTARNDR